MENVPVVPGKNLKDAVVNCEVLHTIKKLWVLPSYAHNLSVALLLQ